MKQYITRAYNSFAVDDLNSKIIKTSATERLHNEILYYNKIQSTELSHFFPRKFSHTTDGEKYKLELEYYDYDDLGIQMIEGDTTLKSFHDKFIAISSKLSSVLEEFSNEVPATWPNLKAPKSKMYIDKTLRYQKELVEKFPFFTEFNKNDSVKINGELMLNFDSIWGDIHKLIEKYLINDNDFCAIHGDMCFSNILYSARGNVIKFIDPRGSFGSIDIYGDPHYDVAKLLHSYEGGYEYIINDEFKLDYDVKSIDFKFKNNNLESITKIFEEHEKFRSPAAKLIQGLIFIGMCSRHYDSLERQVVMYATGLNILNKLLK